VTEPLRPETATGCDRLDVGGWARLTLGGAGMMFLGLFVSPPLVYALVEERGAARLMATEIMDGSYPALSSGFPASAWFERLAFDLTGVRAVGAVDERRAIVHGAAGSDASWPRFIETPCEGGYQVARGPVAGLIADPVHRRFTMERARVLRLEHRQGYAHRGVLGLMRGRSPRVAARFAARIAGDATVAHATAFARAAEAASGIDAPARAAALRVAMLAIERVTGDLAALAAAVERAGDEAYGFLLFRARERIAIALGDVFGHRLMMDIVIPGGLAVDIRAEALPALLAALDAAPSVIRAFGWARVRRDLGAAAPIASRRARAVRAMARAALAALAAIPDGPIAQALPVASGMAVGAASSARGMVHHWLDLIDGEIRDGFGIDPSARLLPVLEAAVVGLDFDAAAVLIACYGLSTGAIDG